MIQFWYDFCQDLRESILTGGSILIFAAFLSGILLFLGIKTQ